MMEYHYTHLSIGLYSHPFPLCLMVQYHPQKPAPVDEFGKRKEPEQEDGYTIENAWYRHPFDEDREWEMVPDLIYDTEILKHERAYLAQINLID